MKSWQWRLAAATVASLLAPPLTAGTIKPIEPAMLAPLVAAGTLPPVAQRLPVMPMVADMSPKWRQPGRHGGVLRLIMGRSKDIRMLVVYGYARLVGHDHNMELRPDILERYEVEDGRKFRLYLRKGHRWSDGHPFTAEDFRYYWEDIANLRELAPLGPPRLLVVEGEKAQFRVIDETTVEFSWSKPNPNFLPAIAGTTPLYLYRPAHYLKQFHARYTDPAKLKALVRKSRRRNWAALHNRLDNQYKNDNPKLPTLQPWINRTKPPAQRFEFARNPYYHRIDPAGHQLPYIDKVFMVIAHSKIIPLKAGAGESDLQARGLHFNNYTFLKEAERTEDQRVRLWRTAKGAKLALFPNLNINDPVWRKLVRDVRFRRALSLSIDRQEINQANYFGLALEGNNTVLPGSPLFRDRYQNLWATYDLAKANRLLDQIGLTKRDTRGVRLLPDGDHRRNRGRRHRADRRPGTGPRFVAQGRHQAVHPAVPARGIPQSHLRWRDAGLDLVGPRERLAQPRHHTERTRTDQPTAAAMAEMGPVLSDKGKDRREASPAGGPGAAYAQPPLDHGARPCRTREDLASHARDQRGQRFHHRLDSRRHATGRGQQPTAQRARKRRLQLEPGGAFRHLQAGHVLAHRRLQAG